MYKRGGVLTEVGQDRWCTDGTWAKELVYWLDVWAWMMVQWLDLDWRRGMLWLTMGMREGVLPGQVYERHYYDCPLEWENVYWLDLARKERVYSERRKVGYIVYWRVMISKGGIVTRHGQEMWWTEWAWEREVVYGLDTVNRRSILTGHWQRRWYYNYEWT